MDDKLIERRASQIHRYLVLMGERQKQTGTNVLLIFDEARPKGGQKSIVPGMQRVEHLPPSDEHRLRGRRWHVPDTAFRFVQFGFGDTNFIIDLPQQTLHPDEAAILLAERPGFFYLRDKQGETQVVRDCNPLEKGYAYGHEANAVDDMLFILLSVWNIPPDFRWFVTSFASGGAITWEDGKLLA